LLIVEVANFPAGRLHCFPAVMEFPQLGDILDPDFQ
jgi:hypothetical protein